MHTNDTRPTAAQHAAEAQLRKELAAVGGTVLSRTLVNQHVQLVVDVPLPEHVVRALENRAMRVMGTRLRAALDTVEPARPEHRVLAPAEPAKPSQRRKKERLFVPDKPLPDDAIVDQDCVPIPRDLYLRLAREKAFPSTKVGKKIMATWGHVKAAVANYDKQHKPSVAKTTPVEPADPDDGLDDLRSDLGLVKKADE